MEREKLEFERQEAERLRRESNRLKRIAEEKLRREQDRWELMLHFDTMNSSNNFFASGVL